MSSSTYPPLCGGVFFRILLNYRKEKTTQRAHYPGDGKPLSNQRALLALIQVTDPGFDNDKFNTIKKNTSRFLNCRDDIPGSLPFTTPSFTSSFQGQMKDSYPGLLQRMDAFLRCLIDMDDMHSLAALVKELLEIIEHDPACADGEFRIGADGSAADIFSVTGICLQSFILGVWYYIIKNRPCNKVDEYLYDDWNGSIERGETVTRNINVTVQNLDGQAAEPADPDVSSAIGNDEDTAVLDDASDDSSNATDEPRVEVFDDTFSQPQTHQIINTQINVEARDNGIAIGQIFGNIDIAALRKRGGKDE